jgi:hypothetical protein
VVAPSLILTDTVLVLRLVGPDCKFVRGEAAKARVRPVGVVVLLPYLDQPTSARQVAEHVRIEALVAEATVQALDEAVLHRLARRDVVPLDLAIFLPLQDRPRCQLGAPGSSPG